MQRSNIRIYKSSDGTTEIEVTLENETVWLNQYQLEKLFQTNRTSIAKHITNIYRTKELEENSTCAKIAQVQNEGKRNVKRAVKYYNLDVIISVGYKVNSIRGTQFRIWANKILKDYVIKGYAINEKRLLEQNIELQNLKNTIKILGNLVNKQDLSNDENKALLTVITDYAYALDILDQYDYQTLQITNITKTECHKLTYLEAKKLIGEVKAKYQCGSLFGKEKDNSFESSISTIYQTFEGNDLYPSIEEKAANLLYFVTKNHSFVDGNKRIAAFLFLYFLERNKILYDLNGQKRISDNALVALTLMIAVSKSDEKDTLTKVVVNLINRNN